MNTTLTEEQKQKRIGRFTASEIHKLMGVKGFGNTGETYIYEKVAEKLTGVPVKDEFSSAATSWGVEHEHEAKLYFQAATGLEIQESDTLELPEFNLAGTPDGGVKNANDFLNLRPEYFWQLELPEFNLAGTPMGVAIKANCGFEIKCPFNSGNHLKNLQMKNATDLLNLRPEYFWQCIAGMWLTGFNSWKFCSYDPRFPEGQKMLILNIDLVTAHMQLLKQRVIEAKLMFESILFNLKNE
jgi:hypothetical protein